jgi:RNA polymerase sigma-70 factor (ECF subfamily)
MELIDRERLQLFENTLFGLPERARKALLLSRMEGWSYPAIARHLGVSPNTVYNDVRMAMAHCMDAVARLSRA